MKERTSRNRPAHCANAALAPSLGLEAISVYANVLDILGDPTRLAIINLLANNLEPVCVCDIADRFDRTQPTISHHLNILREAGLVSGAREGIWAYYSLNRGKLAELQAILADVYNQPASLPARRQRTTWNEVPIMNERKIRVLFLCTHNQARSQMAEGLLRKIGGKRFAVFSAGSQPADHLHPLTEALLKERGVDTSDLHPKSINQFLDQSFDYVITTCEEDLCPTFPGDPELIRWHFEDPSQSTGNDGEQLLAFRRVFVGMDNRIRQFVNVAVRYAAGERLSPANRQQLEAELTAAGVLDD